MKGCKVQTRHSRKLHPFIGAVDSLSLITATYLGRAAALERCAPGRLPHRRQPVPRRWTHGNDAGLSACVASSEPKCLAMKGFTLVALPLPPKQCLKPDNTTGGSGAKPGGSLPVL